MAGIWQARTSQVWIKKQYAIDNTKLLVLVVSFIIFCYIAILNILPTIHITHLPQSMRRCNVATSTSHPHTVSHHTSLIHSHTVPEHAHAHATASHHTQQPLKRRSLTRSSAASHTTASYATAGQHKVASHATALNQVLARSAAIDVIIGL